MSNFSILGCLEVVVLWLQKSKKSKKNSVKLEASLAPAKAEVGAVAKADQYSGHFVPQQCPRAAHALRSDQFTLEILQNIVCLQTFSADRSSLLVFNNKSTNLPIRPICYYPGSQITSLFAPLMVCSQKDLLIYATQDSSRMHPICNMCQMFAASFNFSEWVAKISL